MIQRDNYKIDASINSNKLKVMELSYSDMISLTVGWINLVPRTLSSRDLQFRIGVLKDPENFIYRQFHPWKYAFWTFITWCIVIVGVGSCLSAVCKELHRGNRYYEGGERLRLIIHDDQETPEECQ